MIPLSYIDRDPARARLDRNLVDKANETAGQVVEWNAPTTPGTEFVIRHPEFNKRVIDFQLVGQDAPGVLYRSSPGKWTKGYSFFKYSGAGGLLRVRIR